MPTTNSSQFECSGNELAAGAHNQLFSPVILASPTAFQGGKVLETKSIPSLARV